MIDLRERRPPEPEEFRTSIEETEAKIRELVEDGELPKSEDFPRLWSAYRHHFAEAQYRGKCAYCETRIRAGYPGDVEHYRPRTEVKEPRNRGNRDDTRGERPGRRWHKAVRPGYWWLAYRWNNFVFSCNRCNNWKANSFPLQGERGDMVPGAEDDEKPLILNPLFKDPSRHLDFNELGGIGDLTEEGRITIDRCGLDRKSLVVERERIAYQVRRDIDDYVVALDAKNEMAVNHALRRLRDACHGSAPYAAMARVIVAKQVDLWTRVGRE